MGWFTKLLNDSHHRILQGQYHGKYGKDRIWDNHHSSMVNHHSRMSACLGTIVRMYDCES